MTFYKVSTNNIVILTIIIILLVGILTLIKCNGSIKEGARGRRAPPPRRPPPPPPPPRPFWRPLFWRPPPPKPIPAPIPKPIPKPIVIPAPIPIPTPPPPPPNPPRSNPNFKYVGCYKDTGNRAIPRMMGKVSSNEQCKEIAISNNSNIYGLQYNGECWIGNDLAKALNYGEAGNCPTLGGSWTNQVYTNITLQPINPNFKHIGCYKDTENRAIPRSMGTVSSHEKCKEIAISNNSNIYGVQNNGQCFIGNDINSAMKYGETGNCPTLGGSFTNQVYTNISLAPKVPSINSSELKNGSFLNVGSSMKKGETLISTNGDYILFFSLEGVLTIRKLKKNPDNSPIIEYYNDFNGLKQTRFSSDETWNAGVESKSNATTLNFGKNGNLELQDAAGKSLWSTNTGCMDGNKLAIQDDGYLAIYNSEGISIWATKLNPYSSKNLLQQCKGLESMQNIQFEGFSEGYKPGDFYNPDNYPKESILLKEKELFEKEIIVLNRLNDFNAAYAKFKRCRYNSDYPTNTPLNQTDCTDADKNGTTYLSKLGTDSSGLLKEVDDYIELLEKYPKEITPTVGYLSTKHKDILTKRTELDNKLNELNNSTNSVTMRRRLETDSTIYATLLWTTLATSLIYYTFRYM